MKKFVTLMFALALFSSVFTAQAAENDTGQRFKKENSTEVVSDFTVTNAECAIFKADLADVNYREVAETPKSLIYSKEITAGTTEAYSLERAHYDPGWCNGEDLTQNYNIEKTLPGGRQ